MGQYAEDGWFIYRPKHHKDNQSQSQKHSMEHPSWDVNII